MTILDWILLAALVVVLPAEALWNTVARREKPKRPLLSRLARSLRVIAVLVALLVAIWWREDRGYGALGLDVPLSMAGMIGLGIAVVLLGLLVIGGAAAKRGGDDAQTAAAAADIMPKTRNEIIVFTLFAFAAGAGWELLYRGYLLWALAPMIGTIGAVVVAAIAYALGHGSRDSKSLIGSTIASFLFTIGFALTGSLWWLIVLHTGLPLIGLIAMRANRPAET